MECVSRNPLRRGAAQAAVLLALCAPACQRTDTPSSSSVTAAQSPAPALAAKPAPSSAELRRRTLQLYNETVTRHASYLATAANEGSQRSALTRYQGELRAHDAASRVPDEPRAPDLEREIAEMLESLKIPGARARAVARAPARRDAPAEVPDGTPLELRPDDLRGIIDVELLLPATTALDVFLAAVGKLRRLIVLTRALREETRLRIFGEAYWFFRDVTLPRVALRPVDLEADLRRAGIPPGTDDDQLRKVRALYAEMQSRAADYEKVVALVRESVPHRERLRFLRERTEAQGRTTEAQLLRNGARRN